MSNTLESENPSTCANCGKGEEASIDLKSCAACKLVKYCSRDCQAAHHPQHKEECKRREVELHDEKLFKHPPQLDDCPICMIRLPCLDSGKTYMLCCGKMICSGCMHAFLSAAAKEEDYVCPFCRSPLSISDEKMVKRFEKRIELNDAAAMCNLGCAYSNGSLGLPQNHAKAIELWHRAAELGEADAYFNLGQMYREGLGIQTDKKKAKHYLGLAAMRGDAVARNNLGAMEIQPGNMNRTLRHYMIAAKGGSLESLKNIKSMSMKGFATKDDFEEALCAYQAYLDDIKSDQRDEAAAFKDEWKYYESEF